jgi:hypothetical protein
MQTVIKHKLLITTSLYANLIAWVGWLFLLRHFRERQIEKFFEFSMLVFAGGIAYKLIRNGSQRSAIDLSEIEWPASLVLLHLVPLFLLLLYAIYFFLGGSKDVAWSLMFLAPFISGANLVICVQTYKSR